VRTAGFNTGFCVYWWRRNPLTAGSANDEVLGQIRNARFKKPRFLQRRQTEMHSSNPDQYHGKQKHCLCDP
jgi:hypothetical protein